MKFLTFLFFLLFVLGCSGVMSQKQLDFRGFSPEYYILKKPAPEDFSALRRHLYSQDNAVANSAGIILAFYYIQFEDYNSARIFINRYGINKDVSATMQKFAEYVRFEYELARDNIEEAKKIATILQIGLEEPAKRKAGELYCTNLRIPVYNNNVYACVTARLSTLENSGTTGGHIKPELPSEGGSAYLASMKGPLNILVMSEKDMQDISGGVTYYSTIHELDNKIRMSRSYREGDWDFVLDIDNSYLGGRGYGIYFEADVSETLAQMYKYIDLPCKRLIIGISRKYTEAANLLAKEMESQGSVVKIVDISNTSVGRNMRSILANWEKDSYCAVGAGIESDINNFVPNIKQYLMRRDQRVYVLQDVFTGTFLTPAYISYYQGVRIYPSIDLVLSDKIKAFAKNYEEFSGRKLTLGALMGYEMMKYIHSLIVGGNTEEPYETGITMIKDGKVKRKTTGFYITSKGEVETIAIKEVEDEETK